MASLAVLGLNGASIYGLHSVGLHELDLGTQWKEGYILSWTDVFPAGSHRIQGREIIHVRSAWIYLEGGGLSNPLKARIECRDPRDLSYLIKQTILHIGGKVTDFTRSDPFDNNSFVRGVANDLRCFREWLRRRRRLVDQMG